jgi:hypothetical protein
MGHLGRGVHVPSGINEIDIAVCSICEHRFECFTSRDKCDGLCNPDKLRRLDRESIKHIHIAKAKRQGHYMTSVVRNEDK